jgi:hypothetical protein
MDLSKVSLKPNSCKGIPDEPRVIWVEEYQLENGEIIEILDSKDFPTDY